MLESEWGVISGDKGWLLHTTNMWWIHQAVDTEFMLPSSRQHLSLTGKTVRSVPKARQPSLADVCSRHTVYRYWESQSALKSSTQQNRFQLFLLLTSSWCWVLLHSTQYQKLQTVSIKITKKPQVVTTSEDAPWKLHYDRDIRGLQGTWFTATIAGLLKKHHTTTVKSRTVCQHNIMCLVCLCNSVSGWGSENRVPPGNLYWE